MAKAEEAVALFQQGFNCSQAVLSVFAPDFGLDRDMARRISQGFGAGIARTDDICGALSGAIMVIGLRYGSIRADDTAAKEKTYAAVDECLQAALISCLKLDLRLREFGFHPLFGHARYSNGLDSQLTLIPAQYFVYTLYTCSGRVCLQKRKSTPETP